ncbi:IS701 family transposase [Methylohalobius crimeensis]|uniref:IS701 family transposase n=1 Tax=Methylohalobius crimeensis TaxID=244365 RepID=UPI000424F3AC|nr:transposase [Methylohalobius crimeensis]
MGGLPPDVLSIIKVFAPLFSKRVWQRAQVLLIGAILTPGRRTVAAVLRVMGLGEERRFKNYHRVLSRARWSGLASSRLLLGLLIQAFAWQGPLVMGLDDTIERRWGRKIGARGIYRDPVRSSRGHFVKASGLRWLSLMLLVPIPWAHRVWALPFLTSLCPSERYYRRYRRAHRSLTERARQLLRMVRRWLPTRSIVVVADQSFAALDLLAAVTGDRFSVVTRLRLDAALYEPAPPPRPGRSGRPRKKGKRLPTLAQVAADPATRWQRLTVARWYGESDRPVEIASGTAVWYHAGKPPVPLRWVLIRDPLQRFQAQALLCTDPKAAPTEIVQWFIRRWQVEVTFEETRAHLGLETQRQWSRRAIARTTPILLGLFSLVTLMADRLVANQAMPVRTAAWYRKTHPTFIDALALVRRHLWSAHLFSRSPPATDVEKNPNPLLTRCIEIMCYAA